MHGNSDILYCYMLNINLYMHTIYMFPTKRKAYHGFLIHVGTEEEDSDLPHSSGPSHE